MSTPRILFYDRSSPSSERMIAALEAEGYRVDCTQDEELASQALEDQSIEVLLGEISLFSGELLGEALALPDGPELILFEDFAGMGASNELGDAVRSSAFDTLERPIADDEVLRVVRRALEHRSLVVENRRLRNTVGERFELGNMVSSDPRMGRIFETVAAVADSRANIMIGGESGTGKTMLARAIHKRSARAKEPFVAVNCGALPAALLESELFGHVRGAFTGAVKDRIGKFEAADGGTIFLDEIGTASPELQIKLLRVLEEGCYERVGESETRSVDARLITATNVNLQEEVDAGRFRSDLFYRIHVVGIEVPPLRDRVSDIPLLSKRFVQRYRERHERDAIAIDKHALARLCREPWPGNVRELENCIERAVLLSRGPILHGADFWPGEGGRPGSDLGHGSSSGVSPETAAHDSPSQERIDTLLENLPVGPLREVLQVPERWLIERALRLQAGNRKETARVLGINRTTLFNKMRKLDLLSFPTSLPAPEDSDDS